MARTLYKGGGFLQSAKAAWEEAHPLEPVWSNNIKVPLAQMVVLARVFDIVPTVSMVVHETILARFMDFGASFDVVPVQNVHVMRQSCNAT
jgi:hypothetical protein